MPSCSIVVALGDIEPGEMPPTSAWWPREATQNKISPPPPGPRLRAPECKLVEEGLGVGVVRRRERVDWRTCSRLRDRNTSRPPTPSSPTRGEGEANTGVQTVMSGRCVPPLYGALMA